MALDLIAIENNIPGFIIKEVLHEGAHTLVYRAIRKVDDKKIILKTLASAFPGPNEIAHIYKEYDTLKNNEITGIQKIIEINNHENRPLLIFEDFGGVSLSEYARITKISCAEFLKIGIKIADILGRIHVKNIMHKDINPDNIIINLETGEVQIIDFGISAKLSRERTSVRNPNVLEGTLQYMSPEQTGRMNRSTDYRTDLYSLGITFYKILMGVLPFQGDDAMELVHCHIAKKIPPLTESKPEIPKVISDIVLKLTAKIAEERYQSALGLKYDLEQCLRYLTETHTIPHFKLGQKDVFSKFKIPEHLYGRDNELKILLHSFDEVANGGCKLLLISGFSGIGKTALVNEIHKPTVHKNGYFISGKFDQFKSNIPFNGFALAFTDLLKQIVSEPKAKLDKIKTNLIEELGLNASILIDLIPEFELIVGKQTATAELNTLESQNRFFFTLRDFIRVIATKEHPLTIFLDDLQWCDDSSLSLIKELIIKEIPYLLIIGAYRKNEITDGHPLSFAIDKIKKSRDVNEIVLNPLDELNVNQLIADTLLCDTEETKELATLIFKRTAGNPFYINELLKNIYNDGLINFNHNDGKWNWEIKKISELNISVNVVEFMAERLKELPPGCLEILKMAACIGNTFDLKTLSLLSKKSAFETSKLLWPALEEEIIIPLSENYSIISNDDHFDVTYKFNHDRIQQATYSLVEESQRKELHLNIGRVLLDNLSETEKNEKLVELVRNFNEGIELITDKAEKNKLAEMNLLAGKKAQSAVAYGSALQYFKAGIDLLPETKWKTHYLQTFELYSGYAQNAYQTNDTVTAEKCINLLLQKAKTKLEKVEILSLRLRQYNTEGKAEEAIQAGIEGLAILGFKLSAKPGALTVLKEVIIAKWNLGKRKPADLLNSPVLHDPEKRAAARLLTDIGPSAYVLGNDNLYGLTALKVVNLSLKYGNCPESCFAYTTFGAVLGEAFGDFKSAESFGRLALDLNEKLGDIEYRCRVIAAYGVLTHHLNNHWSTTTDWFKKGIEAGYLSGDLFFLAHCAGNCITWNPKFDLPTSIAEQQKYMKVILDTGYEDAADTLQMHLQVAKNFMGLLPDRLSMNDAQFDERRCLENMQKRKYLSGSGMYHINKAEIFLFYKEYEKSLAEVKGAYRYVKSLVSNIYLTRLCCISFFASTGFLLYGKNQPISRLMKMAKKELSRMKKLAQHNPQNFEHLFLTMEAEMANIENQQDKAAKLYEKAIKVANLNKWPIDEAFANELAAKFYHKNGIKKASSGYLQEAYYLYHNYGYHGKTKLLKEKYPELFTTVQPIFSAAAKTQKSLFSSKEDGSSQVLDVATIVKSSQAISGEIKLESLMSKMMQIIMMNAGAENGVLLLVNNDDLFIQASSTGNLVTTMQNIPLKESRNLPQTIVNYVSRLNEAVVLYDASNQGNFTNDPYIKEHKTKSVMCNPIIFLNKLYGIMYLENNISVGAFTEDRLRILNLLSSQMAISIQNAMLYSNLENKVEERTVELRLEKKKSDDMLHNILPEGVANELKLNGFAEARQFENTTVMFTDFVRFTTISENFTPKELVAEIHHYFTKFDEIIERNGLEKIKTIGDAYLSVCGLPGANINHAEKSTQAALEIIEFVKQRKENGGFFEIRIGLHSGPVVAGIVGVKKFAYDIWGDTVNTAARMESNSEPGKLNISAATYNLIKDKFNCTFRGRINAKNKGMIEMYFVEQQK